MPRWKEAITREIWGGQRGSWHLSSFFFSLLAPSPGPVFARVDGAACSVVSGACLQFLWIKHHARFNQPIPSPLFALFHSFLVGPRANLASSSFFPSLSTRLRRAASFAARSRAFRATGWGRRWTQRADPSSEDTRPEIYFFINL